MNKVMLVGRLARDPELRSTASGTSMATFAVAVDRRFQRDGQPTADFFNVVAWGKQAEVISQYLSKGRQIALNGRLQTRNYQAQDGSKRYVTEVVLEEFDFIGSRSDASGGGYNNNRNSQPAPQNNMPLDDDMDDEFHLMADDDDVPF
jgi:single-strand DNA-binding protein